MIAFLWRVLIIATLMALMLAAFVTGQNLQHDRLTNGSDACTVNDYCP